MTIQLEIDTRNATMTWTYPPGPQSLAQFQALFDDMRAAGEASRNCRFLIVVYDRETDISNLDARSMERMQTELAENYPEIFGPKGMERTAFVCPDEIKKLAIEHFLAHSKGRMRGEYRICDTREEALVWFGQ